MKKLLIGIAMVALLSTGCQKAIDNENQEVDRNGKGKINSYDYIQGRTFRDPESGISFNLPLTEGYVDVDEYGEEDEKMVFFRIQNYDPEGPEKNMLNESEYYIELKIDYAETSRMEDCTTALYSVETIETNDGTLYMGDPGQGGDSGGERYAICFKGNGPDYYLQITENNSEHPVRELIKDSFFQL